MGWVVAKWLVGCKNACTVIKQYPYACHNRETICLHAIHAVWVGFYYLICYGGSQDYFESVSYVTFEISKGEYAPIWGGSWLSGLWVAKTHVLSLNSTPMRVIIEKRFAFMPYMQYG